MDNMSQVAAMRDALKRLKQAAPKSTTQRALATAASSAVTIGHTVMDADPATRAEVAGQIMGVAMAADGMDMLPDVGPLAIAVYDLLIVVRDLVRDGRAPLEVNETVIERRIAAVDEITASYPPEQPFVFKTPIEMFAFLYEPKEQTPK